jgi:hypothetical protein
MRYPPVHATCLPVRERPKPMALIAGVVNRLRCAGMSHDKHQRVQKNNGLLPLEALASEHQKELREAWDEYFGT